MTDSDTTMIASAGGVTPAVDHGRRQDVAPSSTGRTAPMRAIDAIGWHRIRRTAAVIYAVTLVCVVIFQGVPTGRQTIAVIIVIGLSIGRLGMGWRRLGQVLLDWLPFTLVLMAYDKTRAVADAIGMPLHEADVVGWEKALFAGHVPTVWLQHHLYDRFDVHWYDALATLIYTSHFLATPVLAAVLWMRERRAWLQFISRVILLSVAGLSTYILFPEAPPWMASRHGFISEHIARLSARGWIWLHASNLRTTLDHAQQDGTNPIAAMPSLHLAFAALVAIFIGSKLRSRWRLLLVLYPVAMGVALVYLGEHYVVDLIAGVCYAAAVHFAMRYWERRRASRRAGRLDRAELPDGTPLPVGESDRLAAITPR